MPELPTPGTRVSLRYRRPAGAEPPLTDVVGHLLQCGPTVRVRTKAGQVVELCADDIVTVRTLTDVPVKASQIRSMEHAAALAWPGVSREWLDGWLLRAAGGYTHRANSAVPLDRNAAWHVLPRLLEWYAERDLTPWLALPDRLVRWPQHAVAQLESLVMVRAVARGTAEPSVMIDGRPDDDWLRIYQRDVPEAVLTAVIDGEVAFGRIGDAAVGRAAVTAAPDGTRWVGLSAVRVAEDRRRRGHARVLCAALLNWGAEHGASQAYVQVLVDNTGAKALYESMGFTAQHRERYVDARTL
jgi:N-acetylglutamate synthase